MEGSEWSEISEFLRSARLEDGADGRSRSGGKQLRTSAERHRESAGQKSMWFISTNSSVPSTCFSLNTFGDLALNRTEFRVRSHKEMLSEDVKSINFAQGCIHGLF